jgi:AraC-like DNA-binding protein
MKEKQDRSAMAFPIQMVGALVACVERAGIGRASFVDAAAFDVARLDRPDERVGVDEYEALQELAIRLTGNPALGLRMGEEADFAGFDVMAQLVAHASSMREGLEAYLRFQPILGDASPSTLSTTGMMATLRCGVLRSTACGERFRAEFMMTGFLRVLRYFAGADALPLEVSFEHPPPPYVTEYARVFGGRERFWRPFTGMRIDARVLDREPIRRRQELFDLLWFQAERKEFRLRGAKGHTDRLTEVLAASVSGRRPDMTTIAAAMGMSTRSLRRRLTEEHVSYRRMVEQARGGVAKRMLEDPARSIREVAHAMGFAASSAFHRAFRRWTGMTPKQHRERAAGVRFRRAG